MRTASSSRLTRRATPAWLTTWTYGPEGREGSHPSDGLHRNSPPNEQPCTFGRSLVRLRCSSACAVAGVTNRHTVTFPGQACYAFGVCDGLECHSRWRCHCADLLM